MTMLGILIDTGPARPYSDPSEAERVAAQMNAALSDVEPLEFVAVHEADGESLIECLTLDGDFLGTV